MYKEIAILLLLPFGLFAQLDNSKASTNLVAKGVIYKKEFSFEAKLHTLGFAIGFNSGLIKSYHLTKFYHFDIGYLKSNKEKRNNIVVSTNVFNSYSYGKRNYFFPTRIGIGYKKYLSEKEDYHGVAIGYTLEGGVDFGLLKPYFIKIKKLNQINQPVLKDINYSKEEREVFLNENIIYGKGSFFKGFNNLSIVPGVHFNTALHFAFKAYEKPLFVGEIGIMLDAFIKRVPIMVETSLFKNNSIFLNVYINMQIGKRRN